MHLIYSFLLLNLSIIRWLRAARFQNQNIYCPVSVTSHKDINQFVFDRVFVKIQIHF